MIDWTDDAHRVFDEYALKVRMRLREAGADPEEVLGDLRVHIEEAARERGLDLLTGADVSRMLAGMGEPEVVTAATQPTARASTNDPRRRTFNLWLGGVVLPCIALAVQGLTGICSTVLEPMPTLLHGLLIASVPCAMYLGLRELKHGPTPLLSRISALHGFALAIATIYTLLFLPLLPLSIFALIFGLGLLGLSPILSLSSLLFLRRRLRAIAPQDTRWLGRRGALLGVIALLLVELPSFVTGLGMHIADSPNAWREHVGIWILRRVGHEPTMRASVQRTSFEEGARYASLLLFPARMLDPVSSVTARDLYYRATGGTVDGKPLLTRNERPMALAFDRDGWDEDLGTDRVGGVQQDLSLASSRMDVHVKPDDSLAYLEWTQEFLNTGTESREARAQWLLPEGAVVSRVTLWVEGEPREAAFGPVAQVKGAYKEVAVQRRRDPLLVTWSGPNTVLVQGFPIVPKVRFKIRIGITAPVQLDAKNHGHMALPTLVETNYQVASKLQHHVWIESSAELHANTSALGSSTTPAGHALRGELSDGELQRLDLDVGAIDVARTRSVRSVLKGVCMRDANCEFEAVLVEQRWLAQPQSAPKNLAVVIDGSAALSGQREAVAELIEGIDDSTRARVWLAQDEPVPLSQADAVTQQERRKIADRVRDADMIGGMDNAPALIAALDWLEGRADAQLVWIHGPQGIELDSHEGVEQRIERSTAPPRWTSLQLAPGPHRLLQVVAPSARVVSLRDDAGLERVRRMLAGGPSWKLVREWSSAASEAEPAAIAGAPDTNGEASAHVVRLWARDLIATRELDHALLAKLAVQQQLITHASGAVVLETAEQYARHGLTPVDPTSVPSIPEPPVLVMLALGALFIAARQLRDRRRACAA